LVKGGGDSYTSQNASQPHEARYEFISEIKEPLDHTFSALCKHLRGYVARDVLSRMRGFEVILLVA
jgi:hypothetical protein